MYRIGNLYIPSQQSKQLLKINILFKVHNKDTRATISSLLSTWNSINFSLMFSLFFWTSIHMLWYIYTPPSIHLFKFNNSSTRAMCAICSELAKRPTPFWCRYFKLWTDFTYNSVVSVVDFEQLLNVAWDFTARLTFTCLKSTIETQEKGVKYVQN